MADFPFAIGNGVIDSNLNSCIILLLEQGNLWCGEYKVLMEANKQYVVIQLHCPKQNDDLILTILQCALEFVRIPVLFAKVCYVLSRLFSFHFHLWTMYSSHHKIPCVNHYPLFTLAQWITEYLKSAEPMSDKHKCTKINVDNLFPCAQFRQTESKSMK